MSRRLRALLLLFVLAIAPIALARVISYAPYTSRYSYRSHHVRTNRHFALIEGLPGEVPHTRGQVVLYDVQGQEEPRVIYPGPLEAKTITFVAVHDAASVLLLVGTYDSNGLAMTLFSKDGGASWSRVSELDGKVYWLTGEVDFGGPHSYGISTGILTGGIDPFVVGYSTGVYAVSSDGKGRLLAPANSSGRSLAGGDREGSRFLVRTTENTLSVVTTGGTITPAGEIDYGDRMVTGWITPDGSAYVQTVNSTGHRRLYLYRNQQRQLVGAPYSTTPAPAPALPPPPNGPWNSEPLSFFAVPTSDYDGAWMIQRNLGKPTTLSRHTAATGTETFWSDVSGPQVEALHTSASPNRLLIQVHRPRAQAERWFLDPALAIWNAGEPAPRAYDELFLNEAPSKGFIHVDVDAMAGGAPFVFDSGVTSVPMCITCSPPPPAAPGGGGDVTQEWGAVRASLKQRLVLPGIARQPGAFGSYWLTDVVVHNPLDEPQTVVFRFTPIGEVQTALVRTRTETLAAREIRVIRDVVKSLFDVDQGGGVLFLEPVAGVSATARTYTRAGEGTYGFGMQAIDFYNVASPRFAVSFAGAFPGPEYRTNMLLTDTSGRGTETRLRAHGISGTMGVDTIAFSASSNAVLQMNGLAGALGLGVTDSGGLVVQPTRGTAIISVVTMDNRTNDATYFPPDLPAPDVRTIPAIGHVDGAFGARFRSDVYLINRDSGPRTVTLEAKPWDSNVTPVRVPFTLLPGEARVIRDALPKLFGMTGIARLRFNSGGLGVGDGVRVTSRSYSEGPDGGTFGCLVPPFNSFQSAANGEKLEILGVLGGTGFRTNVGLVDLNANYNGQNADARITIVDETGKTIDTFSIKIPFAGGTQINDIFGSRGITPPNAAMIYIEVNHGLIGAYATLTDNVTNDSTFLAANLSAQPN